MTTKALFTCICLTLCFNLFSQSDEDLIRHTIQNYFNGTAYNYKDQIKAAFYAEAELYLENREGKLMKLSPTDYMDFFKGKPGEFTGRYNKILSIDQNGNLALVKAEITIPSVNRVYLDVFIVRKMKDNRWLIVSKAANSKPIEEK